MTQKQKTTVIVNWTNWINKQSFLQELPVTDQHVIIGYWLLELERLLKENASPKAN